MANERPKPWEIAADLEAAAKAILAADAALSAVHDSALPEIEAIAGTEFVEPAMATALQALSDKYQAIADAEPDERAEMELRTGFREEQGELRAALQKAGLSAGEGC